MGFEVRFLGGAFYGDLVDEETTSRKVNEITGGRLRQPWITRTWVLDEDFCRENSLPGEGETFSEYFCKHRGEVIGLLKEQGVGKPEELFEDMVKEIGDERPQLGMNKRLFRNVFRVSEVEMLSRTEAQNAREAGRSLIETSKAILEKELEKKLDYEGFVFEYSKLLGEQAAILVNNKIIHNDLKLHKQNVTLAAEICDFDCAYVAGDLDGYPEENAKPEGFETEDAWRRYQEKLIFEQILILGGAYIRPIARLFNSIEVEISRKVIEEGFLGGFLGEIPEGRKNELSDFMSKNEFGLAFIENLVEPSPSLGNLMEENLSESAVDFLRIAEKLRLALN
jgi:hypothetical protein